MVSSFMVSTEMNKSKIRVVGKKRRRRRSKIRVSRSGLRMRKPKLNS